MPTAGAEVAGVDLPSAPRGPPAERLFIHRKTVRYGLEQTRSLIGLDLSRHSNRVLADLALRLLEVTTFAGYPRPGGVPTAARLAVLDPDL